MPSACLTESEIERSDVSSTVREAEIALDTSFPRNPGFRVMHWHEDLQFIYVIDGAVRAKTLDTEEVVGAGEAIFINKNVVHLVDKVDSCAYRSFLFPEQLVSFYPSGPAERLVQQITENEGISLIALPRKEAWCQKALGLLKELSELEEREKDDLYCYEVLSRLSSMWLVLLKNVSMPSDKVPGSAVGVRLKDCLRYIEQHYAEDMSLDAIARSAGVSVSECLRCFRAVLQTTPYQYLMDYRLSRAARLLGETDLPIGEVALRTGFNGQSYFAKRFRMATGQTPRAYRSGT